MFFRHRVCGGPSTHRCLACRRRQDNSERMNGVQNDRRSDERQAERERVVLAPETTPRGRLREPALAPIGYLLTGHLMITDSLRLLGIYTSPSYMLWSCRATPDGPSIAAFCTAGAVGHDRSICIHLKISRPPPKGVSIYQVSSTGKQFRLVPATPPTSPSLPPPAPLLLPTSAPLLVDLSACCTKI